MAAQTNPNSTAQQSQRFKYGFLFETYKNIKNIVDLGIYDYTRKMTFWNAFQKLNMKNVFIDNGTATPNIVLSNLIITKGLLPKFRVLIFTVRATGLNSSFLWSTAIGNGRLFTDKLSVVMYCEQTNSWQSNYNVATRVNASINLPTTLLCNTGDTVHVWLMFSTANTKKFQDSQYYMATVA